ncbi:hypothetical protein EVAR_53524_1 [Eumeta japonica]|uniref:ATP-dependent DNA helicase n=1 Tax=Eumeta variegata TaxID=151549 RepID=A0A4C1Y5T3_EUMVA|nr:hypothetical protein EVAR_53524_1 [Eumeta japonica]
MDEHPEFDIIDITCKMSVKMLNTVEMSSQEAAWYLLREPMSNSSTAVVLHQLYFPRNEIKQLCCDNDNLDYDTEVAGIIHKPDVHRHLMADSRAHPNLDLQMASLKSLGCVRPLSLIYSGASADEVEERSLVPRSRSRARLRRNATMTHAFSIAYNHTIADQPEEHMDISDLPLPSRSNVLTEAQDAAASTSATPSAEPPTIVARKSKAQKQREYRQRIAASRSPAQAIAAREIEYRKTAQLQTMQSWSNDVQTGTQRQLTHQQHQTSTAEPAQVTIQPGTSSDQIKVQQTQSTWNTKWASSIMRFKSTFLDNDFGYACSICDRLWFKNDLKPITTAQLEVISEWFIKENRRLCREEYEMVCNTCKRLLNKKSMPPLAKVNGFSYPNQPPDLPPLDPISERLISPRLPFMQVRRLRHDFSYGIIGQVINVPVDVQEMVKCLPRQLNEDDVINVNIKGNLAYKSVYIRGYMSKSTISAWLNVLQKSPLYRLYEINVDLSKLHPTMQFLDNIQDDPSNHIENISAENTPESEILASRQHTMMWNEEDCLNIARGHQATPLNIIYDRHAEELSFPSIYFGEPRRFNKGVSVTPYMIATSEIRRRDRRGATPQKILYVAMKILRLRMVDGIYSTCRNVSVTENVTRRMLEDTEFLKEYVVQNLAFMKTVPNSVQYWASRKRDLFALIRQLGKPTVFLTISANEIHWMKLLTVLLKLSKKYPGKTANDLNTSERCTLVSDDPVTCCIYFYRLVASRKPHAHILLWLNDDPRETVSESMPKQSIVEKLSSVARDDVPNNSIYANQIHKHTYTCTKQGETTCRFGIPYWPMPTTRVLIPIPQSDGRRRTLQQKAKELRTSLGEHRYAGMDEFLNANGLTYVSYLDIVRSTLRRPTLVFRRNFDELMTNTFNPYLAGEVNSNIDIQFILDDYSCAEYIVEYVNKSAHGMSNLRRELTTMMQEHPDHDYIDQLQALSNKLLNAFEMSAQEAAWYLLRQPMSETSRHVVYIPTVWPKERQCRRKRRQQLDREGVDEDSTDIWTKNVIQRYEERPASLEHVYLAEFASWYANANDFVDEEDDVHVDDDEDCEAVPEAKTSRAPKEYRRRLLGRIIRYRRYDIDDTVNYKREMVLLYVQFRNEMSEIIDQMKFLQLFDDNKDTIMERRSVYETNLNIENVMKELEATMILQNDDKSNLQEEKSREQRFSIVKKRSNVMTQRQYCELLRTTNPEQREIIVEVIFRLHGCGDNVSEALQIFLTGPAGCGKICTLKCSMETCNRYTQEHDSMNNAYIAYASTDEISMLSSAILQTNNYRLQQITGIYGRPFAGVLVVLCGDFRQLLPVRASPCYRMPINQLGGPFLWHSIDCFPLIRVVRQTGERFSTILTKIGVGLKLSIDNMALIQSRHKSTSWCKEKVPNAVRLYCSNTEVDSYNRGAIINAYNCLAHDIMLGYSSEQEKAQC